MRRSMMLIHRRNWLDSEEVSWCGEKKGETEKGRGKRKIQGVFCDSLFNELIPFLLSFLFRFLLCVW
jgi:hypothetical protein